MGSLRGPRAPRLLVPGCRRTLQKVPAEGVVILTPLPQGFGFTSPAESNNRFLTPKVEVLPISHALPPHSPTLYLTVTLSLTRWLCT